ncbi:uncharacterized protein [Euwallacea fornicatus]|uniref:uncharacterized protein n=1 Tax=Euwallacea fornicatus TaxID=995702 RepID=UPI00338D49D7
MEINTFCVQLVVFSACCLAAATAISIDGQLTVIRNDCYERLAIGEKLNPTQVYKTFDHNTVSSCEKECTHDKDKCRAYSFGIGPKGNGTCLISGQPVKETVDLKPIGTISDPDFDLYVKTLDCQIVLEPPGSHPTVHKPGSNVGSETTPYGENSYENLPAPSNHYHNSVSEGDYHGGPSNGGNVDHVQTLVSIAHGPDSVLHPMHDILVAGSTLNHGDSPGLGSQKYGNGNGNVVNQMEGDTPPFTPPALSHPYGDHKLPYKPPQHYGDGFGHSQITPYWPEEYPNDRLGPRPPNHRDYVPAVSMDRRKYESYFNHHNSFESETYSHYGPSEHPYNYYDQYLKPNPDFPHRYGSVVPHPDEYNRPAGQDYLFVRPNSDRRPSYGSNPASFNSEQHRPHRPPSEEYPNLRPTLDGGYKRPSVPNFQDLRPFNLASTTSFRPPSASSGPEGAGPPSTELSNHYGVVDYGNNHHGKPGELLNDKGGIKVVTESVGYNGEKITSIITELANDKGDACFRRTMAGKRTVRSLVRKLSICETVEQCQQECGFERQFTCEGFNYRLDPTGRGKGDCELLSLPLSKLDINREIISAPDYDFYTRDRNARQVDCRQPPRDNYYPVGSYTGGRDRGYGYGYGYEYYEGNRRNGIPYDRRPSDLARPLRPPVDRWEGGYSNPPLPPPIPRPRPPPLPLLPEDRRSDYETRRGDYLYSHESHSSHSHHYNEHSVDRYGFHPPAAGYRPYTGAHYLPIPPKRVPVIPWDYDKYSRNPPFQPPDPDVSSYPPEKGYWPEGWKYGYNYRYENPHPHYYIPKRPAKPPHKQPDSWGQYGGSYGTSGYQLQYQGYGKSNSYDYWGFDKFNGEHALISGVSPALDGSYLPTPRPHGYLPTGYDQDNGIVPLPSGHKSVKDECSLRSAAGFRLHKDVVKKVITVLNIYHCELLCAYEKKLKCASYAFRYTALKPPAHNCYLSSRNYKELDYYTDLEPDKDYDIYTMNNREKCLEFSDIPERDDSDCFWRVRSGQRLDNSIVRDSLTVKSIVNCQLECLKSYSFVCRAYSFRYGSPVIGGAIDNCQLTDWPFYELDARHHFIPEPGFEIYERGSFGHGCEPNPLEIGGRMNRPVADDGAKLDQICYEGFGSASKLLPQAIVKRLWVPTEQDCKKECSKLREDTLFNCMTLSFLTESSKVGPNCLLSDIMQRDLLPNVDFIHDPNSWMFSWDNHNPGCVALAHKPVHGGGGGASGGSGGSGGEGGGGSDGGSIDHHTEGKDILDPLNVFKIYSVSGWPCKRGTKCRENKLAGFWYCDLEGGSRDAWDYCCSPDHHCGFSNGYSYSWCYVGAFKTQWRKCSDLYYPYYLHNAIDRFDKDKTPWDSSGGYPPPPHSQGFRPDRPNAPVQPPLPNPSLDHYEEQFNNEFLNPPKPGGFGQPKRWPVAYLHKELPPDVNSTTEDDSRSSRADNSAEAIKSLITVLNNTNFQYNVSNIGNKSDDTLYVKIPLPGMSGPIDLSTTAEPTRSSRMVDIARMQFEAGKQQELPSRERKSLPFDEKFFRIRGDKREFRAPSVYRRGFVTRTNLTSGTRGF